MVARVGADLVDQAGDAETRGEQGYEDQQRADVVRQRVAEDHDRGGAWQQAGKCRAHVGQHPHGGRARGVVQHRERDGGDQPHRHDRRPSALAQPHVKGLDARMRHETVELPTCGADQHQREKRADGAGDDSDRDAQPWPEQQAGGQRERGAREGEHGDDDVRGQERQREPRPHRRRPVPQLHGAGQRHQQHDCDENHNRRRDGGQLAPGDLLGRRNHRRTQCA